MAGVHCSGRGHHRVAGPNESRWNGVRRAETRRAPIQSAKQDTAHGSGAPPRTGKSQTTSTLNAARPPPLPQALDLQDSICMTQPHLHHVSQPHLATALPLLSMVLERHREPACLTCADVHMCVAPSRGDQTRCPPDTPRLFVRQGRSLTATIWYNPCPAAHSPGRTCTASRPPSRPTKGALWWSPTADWSPRGRRSA